MVDAVESMYLVIWRCRGHTGFLTFCSKPVLLDDASDVAVSSAGAEKKDCSDDDLQQDGGAKN